MGRKAALDELDVKAAIILQREGMTAAEVGRVLGVDGKTVRKAVAGLGAYARPADVRVEVRARAAEIVNDPQREHPVNIANAALARAAVALQEGRAADAQALIKAGNAVGEFAEFVRELRESGRLGEG